MAHRDETNESSQLHALLPDYGAVKDHFDEVFSSDHTRAAAWYRLLSGHSLEASNGKTKSPDEVRERWRRAKEDLGELTGHVGEGEARRNSEIDPIPIIFESEQWAELSKGIEQRAKLLDLILHDVYGPQALLRSGDLPPELVFGHKGYLQAMRNAVPADRPWLTLYAAHLCCDHTGKWFVLADRTQGPSGAGYAVENRLALSAILPEEFRGMLVQRSAPFFALLRDSLTRIAVRGDDSAWMVLLSPGIRSSAYFEDAYLARYLGYQLAQADDLTVRGGRVYMKTLAGLQRISMILRRLQDFDCDPLELNPAAIGIPGLCQAVRDQQVGVASQLGSGWTEQPALLKFLPYLCRKLLGEELILPSWPTRWCGDADDLEYVRANLDSMIVRDAFSKEREKDAPTLLSQLSTARRHELLHALERAPWKCVAYHPPKPATTPCWYNDKIVAWPYLLRVFAAVDEDGYSVLPSGIARVGPHAERLSESLASGKMSKDVWVLSNTPVPLTTLLRPPQTSMEVRRQRFDLPSRVADQMYWLGRWTARADGLARQARFCAQRLTAERDSDTLPVLAKIVHLLEGESRAVDTESGASSTHEALCMRLASFCFDGGSTDKLSNSLFGIIRNATLLRDRLSRDSWNILSKMDIDWIVGETIPDFSDVFTAMDHLINHLTAFGGLVSESMTRGPGWVFLDIGRRIERIQHQIRMVESLVVPVQERQTSLLEAMLDIMDSSITYRFRYLMNTELATALDLLLMDASNPRAMIYHFMLLEEHLGALNELDPKALTEQRTNIQQCVDRLRLYEMKDLLATTALLKKPTGDEEVPFEIHHELARFMTDFNAALNELSEYLAHRFFTHTAAVQLRSMTFGGES
jgi:uncharacterized circularly permuted ATP-grasp superfamily protein/uncharacterized alpha-E superfamily protein